MVALVVAIERCALRTAVSVPSHANGKLCWTFGPMRIKSKTVGREILCFGDSLVNLGIVPAILQERTGKRTYNLALHNGSPPASYFLFRRAVKEGARPAAIIVDFERGILADGPAAKKRSYPWRELLSLRDAAELAWTARDPDLLAEILVRRIWRSASFRFELRESIRTALKGETDPQREEDLAMWRNLNQNLGATLFDRNPGFRDYPIKPRSGEATSSTWRCDPVNAVYVRKFLELAAQIPARVYVLLPPLSPGLQSAYEAAGDEARYLRFFSRLCDQYPHVLVVDGRQSGFKADSFWDPWHLDHEGAAAMSTALSQILRTTWDQRALTSRWIALPPSAPVSTHVRWEVLGESRAIVRRNRAVETVTK
jgi:hypothetical protein